MLIDQAMTRDVIAVEEGTPLKQVARLLVEHRIGGIPVVDADGGVVGVVSESDFVAREGGIERTADSARDWLTHRDLQPSRSRATTAGELMTRPPITVAASVSVHEAAELMLARNVNRLPVTQNGRLIGILTRADVVRVFAQPDNVVAERLRQALRSVDGLLVEGVEDGLVTLSGTVATSALADTAVQVARSADGVVSVNADALSWEPEAPGTPGLTPRT